MVNYRHSEESPCRKCKDRYPACHSHCDKYSEWQKIMDAEKKSFWKNESGNCMHAELVRDHKNRFVKAKVRNRR